MDESKKKYLKLAAVCILCITLVSVIVILIQMFGL